MKTINLGDVAWAIRDDGVLTPLVDWITEARQDSGLVYLGFGCSVVDASNQPEVQIRCRPRMTMAVAKQLHELLGQIIAEAEKRQ